MKTLTCKMCGSTQLIEENGMYLCQSCGTKYSASELDDNNKTDETPSPEILKEEAETQEEIKRLRALVKDDYSLWSRILELDDGDWEAWYYCSYIFFDKYGDAYSLIGSDDQERFGSNLSRVFEKLKDRASSDSEIKMCIKEVIYRDFKKWVADRLGVGGDYSFCLKNSLLEEIMKIFRNRFISVFGDDYSDFFNEVVKDLDKRIEEFKEESEEELERWLEKQMEEGKKKENRRRIGVILLIIGAIVIFLSTWTLFSTDNFGAFIIGYVIGGGIAGAGYVEYNNLYWFKNNW